MAPQVHHRADCHRCGASLVHLAGDPSIGYEDIEPSDSTQPGAERVLVEHDEQRCAFHRFLTPEPGRHVLPGNADWLTHTPLPNPGHTQLRYQRWTRTDHT